MNKQDIIKAMQVKDAEIAKYEAEISKVDIEAAGYEEKIASIQVQLKDCSDRDTFKQLKEQQAGLQSQLDDCTSFTNGLSIKIATLRREAKQTAKSMLDELAESTHSKMRDLTDEAYKAFTAYVNAIQAMYETGDEYDSIAGLVEAPFFPTRQFVMSASYEPSKDMDVIRSGKRLD